MHRRIEQALEALGHALYQRAWWVIACVALAIGLGATQIPRIQIKAATDDFLAANDPVRIAYDDFLEQFGRDDMMILAIEPPEIFDLHFLEKLRQLHVELEDGVPHLREVQSLVNARETRGEDDRLIVGELLEDWPETAADLALLRQRALANPLYTGLILSENQRLTTLTIELEAFSALYESDDALAGFEPLDPSGSSVDETRKLTGQQELEAVTAVNAIIARHAAPDFRIYAGGAPIINTDLMASMIRDIVLFTAASVCVIATLLTIVFRRTAAVAIPLLVAILSLVSTLAAMGTLGIPAMPVSEIVPSFLLSVGVGGTVHLLVIFQQRLRAGASREEAIAGALAHSGLPIIMTSLTTAGGLASFTAARLMPIKIFGTVAPIGILLTMILTLVLSPALLSVVPLRIRPAASSHRPPSIRLLTRLGDFSLGHVRHVLISCTLLLLAALVGIARLEFSFNTLDWFPDDLPAKVATRKLDAELGGAMSLEVLIDTGSENGLHDPALLVRIDRARHVLSDLQVGDVVAGKSVSLVDIVKEIHQALSGGRPEARAVPGDRRLVSQELLLFENSGSDDLEDVVDSRFSVGRFTLRVPFVDGSQYATFGDEVLRIFDEHLEGRAETTLTGLMAVMGRTFGAIIETMARAYALALIVITPLMMLLLGSFRLGLIAMIPNLFPIVLTLGLMGWAGFRLEMFSLLIGSVALGLAVDDTIHFMHGFRRGYSRTGDVQQAVRETLETTGQAMLFTSIVLSLGFFIYVFSDLTNLTNFGVLTAFAIVMAFLSDVLLAPALMSITARYSSMAQTGGRSDGPREALRELALDD